MKNLYRLHTNPSQLKHHEKRGLHRPLLIDHFVELVREENTDTPTGQQIQNEVIKTIRHSESKAFIRRLVEEFRRGGDSIRDKIPKQVKQELLSDTRNALIYARGLEIKLSDTVEQQIVDAGNAGQEADHNVWDISTYLSDRYRHQHNKFTKIQEQMLVTYLNEVASHNVQSYELKRLFVNYFVHGKGGRWPEIEKAAQHSLAFGTALGNLYLHHSEPKWEQGERMLLSGRFPMSQIVDYAVERYGRWKDLEHAIANNPTWKTAIENRSNGGDATVLHNFWRYLRNVASRNAYGAAVEAAQNMGLSDEVINKVKNTPL